MKTPSPTDELEAPTEAAEHPAASRRTEIVIAVVAIAFMGAAIVLAQGIELRREPTGSQIGARFWPSLLAIVGLALALWRLVVAIVSAPDDRSDQELVSTGGYRRLALTLLLSIAFIALWGVRSVTAFGYRFEVFPVICALYLLGLLWLFGGRGWKALVLFPTLLTAGIYVIFHVLLRIPL